MKGRKYPIGAEIGPKGASFRVYAPACKKVEVVLESTSQAPRSFSLSSEKNGYFSGVFKPFQAGSRYRFKLDEEEELYPDPASRYQPNGPFGPSQVVDPNCFAWQDLHWKGVQIANQVIYEMHIGTFTKGVNGKCFGIVNR